MSDEPTSQTVAAGQLRAFWIVNAMLGFGVSDVARAAGVSKQAVSNAIKELEDDADPPVRAALKHLEEVFS